MSGLGIKLPSKAQLAAERARRRLVRDREAEQAQIEREAEEMAGKRDGTEPLWPTRYADLTCECGFRFLTECWWTDDDERQRVGLIPPKPHIERLVWDWVGDFVPRIPHIREKSRRTIGSWSYRGLETWVMGLNRGAWLITDQTEDNAMAHLWRVAFALEQLAARRPELRLPPFRAKGPLEERLASSVILANGSIMTPAHQKALALQGKGKTGITMEELSKYRNAEAMWGQAIIVTRGGSGSEGGWVSAICNPSMDPLWRELKCKAKPLEVLGWE